MSNIVKENNTFKVITNKNGITSLRLKTTKNGRIAKKAVKTERLSVSHILRDTFKANNLKETLERFNKDKEYKQMIFDIVNNKITEIESESGKKITENQLLTIATEFVSPAINSKVVTSVTIDESKLLTA